jgi:hypothetical protein
MMHYTIRSQALLAVLQDINMPAREARDGLTVLPSRGLASQSGCTYQLLQAIGAGAHATVRFPHA